MSNSSNYVPKPVQVVQHHHHHHHHHHRPPKINVVILIRWRSAILPPTPETQIEIDLDTRFSFFQIAQTQIRSICQVLERYARRFNRTWGISVSWGAKWKNNPLRLVNCAPRLHTITFTDFIFSALGFWSGSEGEQRTGWPLSRELE